jgi:tRNA A37 threonylcarbamoyltransferase TsaD
LPPPALCTDNGAMVAAVAAVKLERGESTAWSSEVDASMAL